ncbi:MAG: acyl-CoA dehydrogenase family protein [Pseudomonadota bacterium]
MGFSDEFNALCDEASELSELAEVERDVSSNIYKKAKELGLFRMFLPQAIGGLKQSLPQWLEIVESLAFADGSVGWIVAHGSVSSAIVHTSSSEDFRRYFFNENNFTLAWSNMAGHDAPRSKNGIQVDSHWRWVTGSTHADFVGGSVRVTRPEETDKPIIRSVLVPRQDAKIDPVWNVMGLAGSGSHDVIVKNKMVSHDHLIRWPRAIDSTTLGKTGDNVLQSSPWSVFATGVWPFSICCAATQLGIAQRALSEAQSLLQTRKSRVTGELYIQQTSVMHDLEVSEAKYLMCRSAFKSAITAVWETVVSGTHPSGQKLREVRLMSVLTTRVCREIVQQTFDLAGTQGIAKTSIFQKLYRDVSCLTSHVTVNSDSLSVTGKYKHTDGECKWL